jgi:hypothetical protein
MQLGPGRPLLTAPPPLEERSTSFAAAKPMEGTYARRQWHVRPRVPPPCRRSRRVRAAMVREGMERKDAVLCSCPITIKNYKDGTIVSKV